MWADRGTGPPTGVARVLRPVPVSAAGETPGASGRRDAGGREYPEPRAARTPGTGKHREPETPKARNAKARNTKDGNTKGRNS